MVPIHTVKLFIKRFLEPPVPLPPYLPGVTINLVFMINVQMHDCREEVDFQLK